MNAIEEETKDRVSNSEWGLQARAGDCKEFQRKSARETKLENGDTTIERWDCELVVVGTGELLIASDSCRRSIGFDWLLVDVDVDDAGMG